MRPSVLAIALSSFALTAANGVRAAMTVNVHAWTREGAVHALELDAAGFLWTSTDRGLCRFDGTSWTCPVATCPGALVVDPQGTVWGCADASGVVAARGAEVRRVPLPYLDRGAPALVGITGTKLALSSPAGVWTWTPASPPVRVDALPARIAVADARGALWLGDDRGVRRAGTSALVLVGRAETITSDGKGPAVAGISNSGLWELPDAPDGPPRRLIDRSGAFIGRSLVLDRARGLVWLAGQFNVEAFDAQTGTSRGVWGTKEGLPHPIVHALAHDLSQGLWAGTAQGTVQLRLDDPILTLGRADGLPGDLAFSLSEGPDGSVWTTSTEGLARWDGRTVTGFDPVPSTGVNYVRSVVAARDGTIWVGSPDKGLLTFRSGRFEPARVEGLPRGLGVHGLRERRNGGLLIGTEQCGLAEIVDGRYHELVPPASATLCPTFRWPVTDVIEGQGGDVWMIAAERRLGRLRGGELRGWDLLPGSPRGAAMSITVDAAGSVWVGSAGYGLFRVKGDEIRNVTTAQGLWDDHVLGLIEDDDARLWLSSRRGLFRLDRAQVDALFAGKVDRVTSVAYQVGDGLRSNEGTIGYGSPAMKTRDGALWFVSVAGLQRVVPRALVHPPALRAVELLSAEVDGQTVARGERGASATVTSPRSVLRFEAVAPSLWQPTRVRYRHRLDGWSSEWDGPSRDTVARWSGVPSGAYVFRVQAFSIDDPRRAVEAAWPILIRPPWFRRTWFLGSLALLLIGIGANGWRARRGRLRRVEEAIQADRHRIAQDIHDSLEQDLTGLKMQVEAASAWLDANPDRARGHLDRAAELVGDGLVDTRNAVWGLRSAFVASAELLAALELRLRRVVDPAGVTLAFESAGPSRQLPSLAASQLVYIVREAVTNAVKHARPRNVAVTVDLTEADRVRVEVRDDGTGLAANAGVAPGFAGGMGIDGMRERVRRLGGTIELASPDGGGTVVKVTAPLR